MGQYLVGLVDLELVRMNRDWFHRLHPFRSDRQRDISGDRRIKCNFHIGSLTSKYSLTSVGSWHDLSRYPRLLLCFYYPPGSLLEDLDGSLSVSSGGLNNSAAFLVRSPLLMARNPTRSLM
jgi:hypothetical protein